MGEEWSTFLEASSVRKNKKEIRNERFFELETSEMRIQV
jgi:hypothetical protein